MRARATASVAPGKTPSVLRSTSPSVDMGRGRPPETLHYDDVLTLQRDAGNQAVQRLVNPSSLLRKGSSGPEVSRLQQALIGTGAGIKADGSFGPATHAAVVEFQQGAGLTPDGVVGPKTWGALGGGASVGGEKKAPADKVALLKAKIALLQTKIAGMGGKPGVPKEASSMPMVEPEMRGGWLDDAADWASGAVDTVVDAASDVGGAVSDAASGAVDAITSMASDVAGSVGDAAGEIVGAVSNGAASASNWVEEKVGAAGQWVGEKAEEVGGFAEGVVDGLGEQLDSLGDDVAGVVGPIIGPIMQGIADLGGGIGLTPAQVDDLLGKVEKALGDLDAAAAGNGILADLGIELGGGTKGGKTDYSAPSSIGAKYTFADADYNKLLATLTSRQASGEEIGSCQPTVTYTLNGVSEGNGLPDDEVVTSAIFTVVDSIQLPDWTNVSQAQPEQQKAWQEFAAGVAAHENLHATDDKGFLGNLHSGCLGKTVKQAVEFVNQQIQASNDQAPKRDASDKPPTLRPAGTTKVP